MITCNGFKLESPNLHQICILEVGFFPSFSSELWKWGSLSDLNAQGDFGHFDSEFQETMFNPTLVFWSKLAKGCYTSQKCVLVCYGLHIIEACVQSIDSWYFRVNQHGLTRNGIWPICPIWVPRGTTSGIQHWKQLMGMEIRYISFKLSQVIMPHYSFIIMKIVYFSHNV